METIRLLVLIFGLLHLSLAFPHHADHAKNCTVDEWVSFVVKSGTSKGDFTPEVISNNTRLQVVGKPIGYVVEKVRNGVRYTTIKTSVTVMISPPLATSAPITPPIKTPDPATTSAPDTSPPIITTEGTTTEGITTEGTTTEGTTTTSSPDPEEFITISGFGSYKYHESEPIENMMEICAKEKAVVAYPIYREETEKIAEQFNTLTTSLVVGLQWNGTYNFTGDEPYFDPYLWDEDEPSNVGNCTALNLVSERLKSISCSEMLPFLCKKDDGFEKGYGFYTLHGPAYISEMEYICNVSNRTVAVPQSTEEVEVMHSHALDTEPYLSVGLKKIMNGSREQYMRVGVLVDVNEDEEEQAYVNISSKLWQDGKLSGSGDCIVLNTTSKKLIGNRCKDVKFPFLCKKDLTPPASVTLSDGAAYQYQPWYKTGSKVTALCKAQGYTGAAFQKGKYYDKLAADIAGLIPDDEPYIATGIKYTREEPMDSEDSEEAPIYTYRIPGQYISRELDLSAYWDDGEPNNDGDCIKFSKISLKFLDYDCKEPLPYICVK